MTHNMPLCQSCNNEHQQELFFKNQVYNTNGGQNGSQNQQCNIKHLPEAIKESITMMHVSLKSVQEFIKKKDATID